MEEAERRKKSAQLRKLSDKYYSLRGAKIINELLVLQTSHHIVNYNYRELQETIESVEGDITLMYLKNRCRFDFALREITRRLHNYLASIQSLIDHTRRFRKTIDNPRLEEEFRKEIQRLTRNKCTGFVKKFRNYIQHFTIPIITGHLEVIRKDLDEPEFDEDFRIELNKDELLKWDGWGQSCKNYIDELGDELVLKNIFEEYERLNNLFYDWFYNKVIELHREEIDELRRLERKIEELEKEVFMSD